jgi:ABC-type multidrug transport system fused ATPase/permease subunit
MLPSEPIRFLNSVRWVSRLLWPHSRQVVALLTIVLFSAALNGIADPLVTKTLIDSLVHREIRLFLLIVLASIVVFTLVRQLIAYSERLQQQINASLIHDLTLRCLKSFYAMPLSLVEQRDTSYFVSRIFDEAVGMADVIQLVLQSVSALALFSAAVSVCFYLSWKTALLLSLLVPLLRFAARRYSARISAATLEGTEFQARLREVLGASVDSYTTVRIFDLIENTTARVSTQLYELMTSMKNHVRYSAAFKALSGTLLSYAELSMFVGAGFAVIRGSLSIGGLFGFVSAYGRTVSSFESLATLVPALASFEAQRERFDAFTHWSPALDDTSRLSLDVLCAEAISFRRNASLILSECSVRLAKGTRVLVYGPNGSGKTSLAKLLCGLFPAEEGALTIPPLRQVSALLTPFYFIPGTLRDNLGMDPDDPAASARFQSLAGILGLESSLDRDPSLMSEGEKRKAQIAMVLMKEADFYILDEPLANIDSQTREGIMQLILSETKGKGLLMIMHGSEYSDLFDFKVHLQRPHRVTPELPGTAAPSNSRGIVVPVEESTMENA